MTIREIVDRVIANDDLLDVEKSDFLCYLRRLFDEECKPHQDEIDELIKKYD